MRYFRAFFKALSLTLQGKTIKAAPTPYPKLQDWVTQGSNLIDAVYTACKQYGLDESARKNIVLRLDGRDWSMDLILSSVRYHSTMEYPSLLEARVEHNITTFYALNIDDQYRVDQLAEVDNLHADVRKAVQTLAEHLQNIPSSNEV
jgi:hypothetical protein